MGGKGSGQGSGGIREGQGRPRLDVQRRNVSIDAETAAILIAYGDGNLSEGIRRAGKLVLSSGTIPTMPASNSPGTTGS